MDFNVLTVGVASNQLYAGGAFSEAGSSTNVKHVARWTGSDWTNVGSGFDSWVSTCVEYNGDLIAGGLFVGPPGGGGLDQAYAQRICGE